MKQQMTFSIARIVVVSLFVLATIGATTAVSQTRPAAAFRLPPPANAPHWRFVDGHWVRPDRTAKLSQFIELVEQDGRHGLAMRLAASIEPMLANYRTAVIEIDGNPFAWKASTIGRTWNFNRSAGTQHLQLIAAVQDTPMPAAFTLTKIEITPQVSSFQATARVDDKPVSVIVVLTPQFTELAVSELGEAKAIVMARSASARNMLCESPLAARKYLIPALQLLTGGENPLQPAAGDVYRAFDIPADPVTDKAVRDLLPRLAAPDARARDAASAALAALGRRGVQSAMRLNPDELQPEAAARVAALLAQSTIDPRPAAALRGDLTFVIDCIHDLDPLVRGAAETVLRTLK